MVQAVGLTDRQQHVLHLLAIRPSTACVAHELEISRRRVYDHVKVLRAGGMIQRGVPEDFHTAEITPQNSIKDPTAPPARIVRFGGWVIRAVLLPREDTRQLPHALPDEKVIVVTNKAARSRWCWIASRRRRWSTYDTVREITDINPDTNHHLTLAIAYALDVEAVLIT